MGAKRAEPDETYEGPLEFVPLVALQTPPFVGERTRTGRAGTRETDSCLMLAVGRAGPDYWPYLTADQLPTIDRSNCDGVAIIPAV
jgi:hypothetical protein